MLCVKMVQLPNGDESILFEIPDFEYSNASFFLMKNIIKERNFLLHQDLQMHLIMFATMASLISADNDSDSDEVTESTSSTTSSSSNFSYFEPYRKTTKFSYLGNDDRRK